MKLLRRPPTRRSRAGFTLVEALVSLSIAVTAATGLLLGVAASFQTTQSALEQATAQGMAEQVIDEALGKLYVTNGDNPYTTSLGPSSTEQQGTGRERYNDTDDFNGFTASPPVDLNGIPLGKDDGLGGVRHASFRAPTDEFSKWKESVSVFYVSNTNPSTKLTGSSTSNFRAIEVTISRQDPNLIWRQVAVVRRVFSYIPTP